MHPQKRHKQRLNELRSYEHVTEDLLSRQLCLDSLPIIIIIIVPMKDFISSFKVTYFIFFYHSVPFFFILCFVFSSSRNLSGEYFIAYLKLVVTRYFPSVIMFVEYNIRLSLVQKRLQTSFEIIYSFYITIFLLLLLFFFVLSRDTF